MIVACNNNIKEVQYSGFTITKVYACGGELVYTKDSSFFVKNHYKSGSTILYDEYSCDQMTWWDGVLSCGVIKHYNTGTSVCYSEDNGIYIIDSVIGDCVTSIDNSAYKGCSQLSSVTFSNSVTNIDSQAFSGCTNLESVTIPNSVTTISSYAFAGGKKLRSITIGSGVTSIGAYAFNQNTGQIRPLNSVKIYATTPPTLGTDVFKNDAYLNIYVPAASVNAYKSAWTTLADKIQAIA